MSTADVLRGNVQVRRLQRGRRQLQMGVTPGRPALPAGRVPRVARLLALAIKLDGLVRRGAVPGYAALARLGHVSRAHITQIMNLLLLAPDIQEEILFLPRSGGGRDPMHLRHLQPIALTFAWHEQRALWRRLCMVKLG